MRGFPPFPCAALLLWGSIAGSTAAVRYVNPDAQGNGSGGSWQNAHTSLTAAIDASVALDEIWMAAGVYYPETTNGSADGPGGERRKTFLIVGKPLAIYGGFAGTETQRSQRDWNANETVLSGDLGVPGNPGDNAASVLAVYSVSDTFVDPRIPGAAAGFLLMDGVTIRDGRSDVNATSMYGGRFERNGGAIYLSGSSAAFANCRFINNYAISGGAIYSWAGKLNLMNCEFRGNSVQYHGGAVSASGGNTNISHCAFVANNAGSTSAALYAGGAAGGSTYHLNLTNSIFASNTGATALNIAVASSLVSGNLLQQEVDGSAQCFVERTPFIDVATGNLQLRATSRGIDLGTPAGILKDLTDMDGDGDSDEPLPLTFDGQPRPPESADSGLFEFVNSPPTALALNGSEVTENLPAGRPVGNFLTEDPNFGDFEYALVQGEGAADNASFQIISSTLQTAEIFDFETRSEYSIRVRSTDVSDELGQNIEATFTIMVIDAVDQRLSIEATHPTAYEPRGGITPGSPHVGAVEITRTGETEAALSVPFWVTSNARSDEYLISPDLPTALEFAPGETTRRFEVAPLFDREDNEGTEYVRFEIGLSPQQYEVVRSQADVRITDGAAEAFLLERGFSGPFTAASNVDLNSNGLADVFEFLFNDPAAPEGFSRPQLLQSRPGEWTLSATLDPSVSDLELGVEYSDDLQAWLDWPNLYTDVFNRQSTFSLRIAPRSTTDRQFTRFVARPVGRPQDFPTTFLTIPTEMLGIPAGMLMLGSNSALDERPVTNTQITRPFWISAAEITQFTYGEYMNSNPSSNTSAPMLPVENLTAAEAEAFCARLTELEGADGRLPDGYVYRLPTEAEWEYACRAGTSGERFMHDLEIGLHTWYSSNSFFTTHEVARKEPNAWGLYDTYGNVAEWCHDGYSPNHPGGIAFDPVTASTGAATRSVRGSHYAHGAAEQRSAFRSQLEPDTRSPLVGFRVVLAPALPD